MYKLIIIFLVFSFCSSTSVEEDSIVPQQNNENNNSSVSNESQESLITTEDNEEIENFSDQEQIIEDEYIEEFSNILDKALTKEKIKYDIKGRPKSIFSIRRKMQRQGVSFEEVYDKFAVRIIYKSGL